jgi:hypothetical protein
LIPPTRVVDTRPSDPPEIVTTGFDGTTRAAIPPGPLQANTTHRFLINGKTFPQGTGTFTFPSDTYGVLANVTIVQPSASGGFVTVCPGDVTDANRPLASTVDPSAPVAFDSTVVAIAPSGSPPSVGTIAVYSTNTLDLVVDVYGYFTAPLPPTWSVAGNSGTTPGTAFLGTTDAQPLVVKTNNAEALRITISGTVGISTTTPQARLDVQGGDAIGVEGRSSTNYGVVGTGRSFPGVFGASNTNGVVGQSDGGAGVLGQSVGQTTGSYGVQGTSLVATGVYGSGITGVEGNSDSLTGAGVEGSGKHIGVYGSGNDIGVSGETNVGIGVKASSLSGVGLTVQSGSANLVEGYNDPAVRKFHIDNNGAFFAKSFTANSNDYAELLPGDADLEPGDVLLVGEDGRLVRSARPAQAAVVGVVSTEPGILGGLGEGGDPTGKVPLAIVGIVPTKVSAENGAIKPGDLLTTASTPAHAMKATLPAPQGTLLGKALEPLGEGTGVIRVLVSLR